MIGKVFTDIIAPLQNSIRYGSSDIFSSVAMETTSWCNRSCSYCPSGKVKRKNKKLEPELIQSVLEQLGAIRFNGTIYLHLFNEPLFDVRLPSVVSLAREKCPDSRIFISSNGDNLTISLMNKLIDSGIDLLYVTQYDGAISRHISKVSDSLSGTDRKKHINVRVQNVFENNRGGTIDFMKINEPLDAECYRPDNMLVINAFGKVVLCCNDYFGKEIMGDITTDSLLHIWHNEKFRRFRNSLRGRNRNVSTLCKGCNEIINSGSHTVRELSKTTAYKLFNRQGLLQ
jgi:radical SAM protein with 4Fe4S-binding SPASM domain